MFVSGAHIIVCTPGRMIDMLAANSGKVGFTFSVMQGYIFWPTGKNLKEDVKKGREKGGKKKKNESVIKYTLKYLYEA